MNAASDGSPVRAARREGTTDAPQAAAVLGGARCQRLTEVSSCCSTSANWTTPPRAIVLEASLALLAATAETAAG